MATGQRPPVLGEEGTVLRDLESLEYATQEHAILSDGEPALPDEQALAGGEQIQGDQVEVAGQPSSLLTQLNNCFSRLEEIGKIAETDIAAVDSEMAQIGRALTDLSLEVRKLADPAGTEDEKKMQFNHVNVILNELADLILRASTDFEELETIKSQLDLTHSQFSDSNNWGTIVGELNIPEGTPPLEKAQITKRSGLGMENGYKAIMESVEIIAQAMNQIEELKNQRQLKAEKMTVLEKHNGIKRRVQQLITPLEHFSNIHDQTAQFALELKKQPANVTELADHIAAMVRQTLAGLDVKRGVAAYKVEPQLDALDSSAKIISSLVAELEEAIRINDPTLINQKLTEIGSQIGITSLSLATETMKAPRDDYRSELERAVSLLQSMTHPTESGTDAYQRGYTDGFAYQPDQEVALAQRVEALEAELSNRPTDEQIQEHIEAARTEGSELVNRDLADALTRIDELSDRIPAADVEIIENNAFERGRAQGALEGHSIGEAEVHTNEVKPLEAKLRAAETEIEGLRSDVESKDRTIEELEAIIKQLRAERIPSIPAQPVSLLGDEVE